jgi:hypothetical protein
VGQFATLSVSRLGGLTTINIGTPSDKVVRVACEGDVTLKIFDLSTTPLYTIIPSIMSLNKDYIFKVLNGIQKKVSGVPGKNPKAVELYSLLVGARRMIDNFDESMKQTIFSYYTIKENQYAINKFNKKQIQHIPALMHSMQNSDDELVFELCKVEGSTFAELTSKMFLFSKMSLTDDISEVLPLLAQFLKVRKGFTGDTRETPIPNASKGFNGGVDLWTCYVSQMGSAPQNIIDLLGLTMFRHIGLRLSDMEIIILFTELLHSKIPLNEGVKEVLEELLSRDFVALDQMNMYSDPTCMSMWQTSKLIRNIPLINRAKSEITAFIFLFQTWFLDSNPDDLSFEKMAEIFGFDFKFLHDKSLKALNESIKLSMTGFDFRKWSWIVNSTWSKKVGPHGYTVIVQREKEDLLSVFKGLYNSNLEPTEEKYTEKFENFVDFMKSNGIEFKECPCCNNLYLWSLVNEVTESCNVCSSSVCLSCIKTIYQTDPVEGHVLNMSSVSCINCRTVFPTMTNRFPEGTLVEDIVSHSNEFYSCCVRGCRNFVHVQQEGVGCANRLDTVVDTFCTTHDYMNTGVAPEMYKECPGCHAMVMKSDGCNHMTCNCGAEFCMCQGCPYVKPVDEVYTHPFYCRYGISDHETRFVLETILRDLSHNINGGVIPQELVQSILIRMQQIMYQGIVTPLRAGLWELSDYMNLTTPNAEMLTTILYNIEAHLNVDFPFTDVLS